VVIFIVKPLIVLGLILGGVSIVALLTGCATIMPPAAEPVLLSSQPPGALVWINGEMKGMTPVAVSLACQSVQMITFLLDGFDSVEVPMPTRSAWDGRMGITWPAEKCQGVLTVVLRPQKETR
jgi:hypothetical protein